MIAVLPHPFPFTCTGVQPWVHFFFQPLLLTHSGCESSNHLLCLGQIVNGQVDTRKYQRINRFQIAICEPKAKSDMIK